MKRILLTGAAGFIAAKTAQFLLEEGFEVVGVDNLNDYYDVELKKRRLKELDHFEHFTFYHSDIENYQDMASIFERHQFDTVINLAARAGVRYSMDNPHVYFSTNVNGTLNLLELMNKHSIRKKVLASTSSLYAGQKMPFKEFLPVNTPISPYAASKKAAEALCYSYHHLYDIDVTVLRYFTVFGPGGRPDMSVDRFIKWIDQGSALKLYGDGSQARDFTYVDDIAKGTILAAKAKLGYEIINLGGGNNPVTLTTLISWIEQSLGKKAKINFLPFHKADMKETWADIEKAKRLLGWSPEVSPQEGLERAIRWYQKNS